MLYCFFNAFVAKSFEYVHSVIMLSVKKTVATASVAKPHLSINCSVV